MEDGARKVEREMQKRIAAVVLHPHIGQSYPAIVTGVNNYGTFVRTLDPHVEGKLVHGGKGLDVGDKVTVKLVSTDPERGIHRLCGVRLNLPILCWSSFNERFR